VGAVRWVRVQEGREQKQLVMVQAAQCDLSVAGRPLSRSIVMLKGCRMHPGWHVIVGSSAEVPQMSQARLLP